jgi:hypothetical protein
MTEFCGVPIVIHDDMPVGCMVVVSGNGRQVIPIVSLDLEIRSTLTERVDDNGPIKIMPGPQKITGKMTCTFEDPRIFESYVSDMKSVGRHVMESIIRLGDAYAKTGQLNRSGRNKWRKDRKLLMSSMRRADARLVREAYGLATF